MVSGGVVGSGVGSGVIDSVGTAGSGVSSGVGIVDSEVGSEGVDSATKAASAQCTFKDFYTR